jgi:hypothetical protein
MTTHTSRVLCNFAPMGALSKANMAAPRSTELLALEGAPTGVLSNANIPVGGILDSLSLPEGLAKLLLYHIPLPHRPRGKKPIDQSLVTNPQELPPYLSDVVAAVRSGVVTARAFAKLKDISIQNASTRFQKVRQLGWIAAGERHEDGIHYAAAE